MPDAFAGIPSHYNSTFGYIFAILFKVKNNPERKCAVYTKSMRDVLLLMH